MVKQREKINKKSCNGKGFLANLKLIPEFLNGIYGAE